MRPALDRYGLLGFGLSAAFAIVQRWSLPAFCWSLWLTGLAYACACVLSGALQIILSARSSKTAWEPRVSFLTRVPPTVFVLGMTVAAIVAGLVALRLYAFLFAFYGLFLSVFAEMPPLDLFGRNGFINSDFYTPVTYLGLRYWPMAAGVLLASWEDLLRPTNPWQRILLPVQREVLRMHLLILAMPILSLAAWAVVRDHYQSVVIVLLMGILFLLPKDLRPQTAEGAPAED